MHRHMCNLVTARAKQDQETWSTAQLQIAFKMQVATRRDYVYSTCRIMVLFSAKLKSTLHSDVGSTKIAAPIVVSACKVSQWAQSRRDLWCKNQEDKEAEKNGNFASKCTRQGTTDQQHRNIREENQNGASGDEGPQEKGWHLSKFIDQNPPSD